VGVASATLQVSSAQIGVDGPDTNYLAYCCEYLSNNPQVSTVNLAVSVGGQAYTRLAAVAPIAYPKRTLPYERNFVGAPIVLKDALVVPYYVTECISSDVNVCQSGFPSDSRLYVARSTDGGKTFSDGAPVFSIPCTRTKKNGQSAGWVPDAWCQGYHGIPHVVADAGGALHAVWDDEHHVYLSTSRDQGRHWTPSVRVDSGLNVSAFPTIAAGDSGRVDIAWLGSTSAIKDPSARDAEWYVYMAQSLDASSRERHFTQTLVSDHRVHRGVLCQRGACAFGNGAGVSEIGNWFRLAVSPIDGRAVIAYGQDAGVPGQGTAAGIVATRQCDGPSLLINSKQIPCEPGDVAAQAERVPVACAPQGDDPKGDAELDGAQAPELDLRSMGVRRDKDSLTVTLGLGAAPPATPPSGYTGEYWTAYWHYGKLNYYVQAASPQLQDAAPGSTVGFSYGIVNDKGGLSRLGAATGSVDGTTITWTIPADRVGSPKPRTLLSRLQARTDALSGATPDVAPAVSSARSTQVDVLTADFGYDPALACATAAPAAPAAAPAAAPHQPLELPAVLPAPLPQAPPSIAPAAALPGLGSTATSPAVTGATTSPSLGLATKATARIRAGLPLLGVLAPAPLSPTRTPPLRRAGMTGASTPTLEVPLLPCSEVPPAADPVAHKPGPQPAPPPAKVPTAHPPQVAVGVPVEPPVSPAGPAPAPAPAPQPQPGPANQAQAQQQVSSQTQPGLQAGLAAVPDPALRQARAYAASRSSSPYPSTTLLWAWTFALISLGGALAARQRALRPARSGVWGRMSG
jgi:hypothetical protein